MTITEAIRLQSVKEYYFSKKLREIAEMKTEREIISLGIGSPDMQPPKEVIEELISSSHEGKNGYQSYKGIPEMRKAMADFYQKYYEVELNPETEILPLIGSKEGIMHISMAFLNLGDAVLVPNPGYPTYSSVSNLVQAKILYYDLKYENNWLPDFLQLDELAQQKPKIMWLNYPHMPTGAKADFAFLEKLIHWAKKNNILLVNDNPYSFILNENPQSILAVKGAKEIAMELNSLSKTFNIAGWRVGMLLGNEDLIQSVLKVKSNMDSGMNYAIQKASAKALSIEKSWYEKINKEYAQRRNLIWQIADKLELKYDENTSGLFVWTKLPEGFDDMKWTDELLYEKQIFATPGSIFGSNGKGFVRFSLCISQEKLNEVLKRVS